MLAMTKTPYDRIAERLGALGLSENEASAKATGGKNRDLIRKMKSGETQAPRGQNLAGLARALGVSADWILNGDAPSPEPMRPTRLGDVPILGTAAGAVIGAPQLFDQPIDYAMRPPGLSGATGVYALFVTGESMAPMFGPGQVVFVSEHRPPRAGDAVIVQTRTRPDAPIAALIKLLARRAGDRVELSQIQDNARIAIPEHQIVAVHRVYEFNELFGL